MFARRIDGAISQTLSRLTRGVQFTQQSIRGEEVRRGCPQHGALNCLLDRALDLIGQGAGILGNRPGSGDKCARWLELRNKIAAYRLFAGRDQAGHSMGREAICRLEPYSRLFAAEGYVYRDARFGALVLKQPPELSSIAIHAGAGLQCAEQALENVAANGRECQVLAEFSAGCRRNAIDGFGGIMEEALGLVARTMYPHLLERLDVCLRRMNVEFCERFWHGVGRGIYFAPSNIPPFRTGPWKGVGMCLGEPPHRTGKRNALSGFCFALTLVNLQQPEVLEAFFKHHATQALECIDGVEAAVAVWKISGGSSDAERNERLPVRLWLEHATEEDRRWPERLFSAHQPSQAGPLSELIETASQRMVNARAGAHSGGSGIERRRGDEQFHYDGDPTRSQRV